MIFSNKIIVTIFFRPFTIFFLRFKLQIISQAAQAPTVRWSSYEITVMAKLYEFVLEYLRPLWGILIEIHTVSHWIVNEANRDNGIEIPEAWIPTIRKHNGRPVRQQTAEGTTWAWSQTSQKTRTNRNNGDRNPPIVLDHQGTNGNS